MANPEHLAIIKQGVGKWNAWRGWRVENRPHMPDLSNAELRAADLFAAYLSAVDLGWADLRDADLGSADLSGANLTETDLSGANLTQADLRHANLRGAYVNGADFTRATAGWTLFADVDLSQVRGLETIKHTGPSTIGIDTIHKSGGNLPDLFVRRAGVPDTFITYLGALVGKPIDFYSCFISYSAKDQEFADRLYADLQTKGVRCWFAAHHIAAGKKIYEQIVEAIRLHERLLLILSPASMESEWVKTEIAKARKRETREKRRVLFPVRLVDFEVLREWECFDADTGKDSAREIREYFIPDFSRWKDHDSYQQAFECLLRDLKSEAPTA